MSHVKQAPVNKRTFKSIILYTLWQHDTSIAICQ